ncbi:hypothetical protein T439DRAFT_138551 [Meredithblackwellia eburnea MCA 4105]
MATTMATTTSSESSSSIPVQPRCTIASSSSRVPLPLPPPPPPPKTENSTLYEQLIAQQAKLEAMRLALDEETARYLSQVDELENRERQAIEDEQMARFHAEEREAEEVWERERIEREEREERETRALLEAEERRERDERERGERWFEEEKRKHEEREKSRVEVVVCETCEGEFGDTGEMVQCSEGHLLCLECAALGISARLEADDATLCCLVDLGTCEGTYTPQEAKKFLDEKMMLRWGKMRLNEDVKTIEGVSGCPHCDYAVLIEDPNITILVCQNPECRKSTCLKCREESHHPKTCLEANPPKRVHDVEEEMTAALIRNCPKCSKKFVKEKGCNKITCKCGTISCYLCRAIIKGYSHFDDIGPCKGKLFDDKGVEEGIEQARRNNLNNAAAGDLSEEERRLIERIGNLAN